VGVAGGSEGLSRVRRLLDEAYAESHALGELAALAGMDPSYLCRAFRKSTGRTLTEYLLERRLRAAVLLLRSGARNITEVARSVGYGDPAYFTRVFTRRIGMNPRRYLSR
jgi:two-component system response regulator YesN